MVIFLVLKTDEDSDELWRRYKQQLTRRQFLVPVFFIFPFPGSALERDIVGKSSLIDRFAYQYHIILMEIAHTKNINKSTILKKI